MPSSRYIFGTLPWYSVLILLGMIIAIVLAAKDEKRAGFPKDTVIDLCLFMLPFGIIGARLYYVIFAWDEFAQNPVSALYIWQGGLAIYGGIIAGFATAVIFARRRKLNLMKLLDLIIPGVVLAQGIGRWGNFFNMEAYGLPIETKALQFFPLAVLIPEAGGSVWHMATFFYESCWDVMTFAVLYFSRKKVHVSGDTFFGYLLLYGCGRFIVEGLRMDSLMSFSGSFRVSQWLSLAMAALACGNLIRRRIAPFWEGKGKILAFALVTGCAVAALASIIYGREMMLPMLLGVAAAFGSVFPFIWSSDSKKWLNAAGIIVCGAAGIGVWIVVTIFASGWLSQLLKCCDIAFLLLSVSAINYAGEKRGDICPQQS